MIEDGCGCCDSVSAMAPAHTALVRLRAGTPASVGTPVGATLLAAMALTSFGLTPDGLGEWVFAVVAGVSFAVPCASFLDRLHRMRAHEASRGMTISLAVTALYTDVSAFGFAFGGAPRHEYIRGGLTLCVGLALTALACREGFWLRTLRRGHGSPAAA